MFIPRILPGGQGTFSWSNVMYYKGDFIKVSQEDPRSPDVHGLPTSFSGYLIWWKHDKNDDQNVRYIVLLLLALHS